MKTETSQRPDRDAVAAMSADERREQSLSHQNLQTILYNALLESARDVWIVDFGDDWVVWESWYCDDPGLYVQSYTLAGNVATLSDEPEEVVLITSFEAVERSATVREWAYAMATRVKYTQDEIDKLGAKGKAFKNSDGHFSYPIADEADLGNAIKAVGRGGADHDSIRKYIIRRAKELGASDEIPDNWSSDGTLEEDSATTGDSSDDGTSSGGSASASGVTDGSGSTSSDEPHEERAAEACGCSGSETCGCESCECGPAEAPEERDDAPTPAGCAGGCTCEGCSDCTEADAEQHAGTEPRRERRRFKPRVERDEPQARSEVRMVARGLEVRSSGGDIVLEGQPIVYDVDYQVHDALGAFTERMAPTACDGVLARTDLDCRFLYNHDGMVLARTVSGTLELSNSTKSLTCAAHLDERSSLANDLAVAVERGDVSQMSIGFITARDAWSKDFSDRTVESLQDLLDVSAVSYPASPTTSIGLAQRALFGMSREARADVRKSYRVACDVREGTELGGDCVDLITRALERLYVVDDPGIPVVRVRAAFGVMRDLRAGKALSASNASFIQTALASLARADDVDIPDIVTTLQDIDGAVDEARDALSAVSGLPSGDGDEGDLEPTLTPADGERAADEASETEAAETEAAAAERLRIQAQTAKARLEVIKKRR